MSSARIQHIKLQTIKLEPTIQWKNNASCVDLREMAKAAKLGLDCGRDRTMEFMPTTGYHDWVHFAFVITKLYNRDRSDDAPELLCMIRTAYIIYLFLFKIHRLSEFPV